MVPGVRLTPLVDVAISCELAMAKEAGFVMSTAELEVQLEVSDDELEGAAGGVDYSSGSRSGRCIRYIYCE